jgi:hypothetical protein
MNNQNSDNDLVWLILALIATTAIVSFIVNIGT